jgi:hypothetical protein
LVKLAERPLVGKRQTLSITKAAWPPYRHFETRGLEELASRTGISGKVDWTLRFHQRDDPFGLAPWLALADGSAAASLSDIAPWKPQD